MNEAKEKSLTKRLFAIFLLILALSVMIGMPDSAMKRGIAPQSVRADEKNGKVTIRVIHEFNNGAEVILQKKDAEGDAYTDVSTVSIGTAVGNFVYDLDSTEYDSFYIKEVGDNRDGNKTESVTTETLIGKKGVYGSSFAVKHGGWINESTRRSVSFGVPIFIKHDFTGGASVCYVKGNTWVETEALPSDGTLLFDLESSDYDGFYIEETGTTNVANKTEVLDSEKITAALGDSENSSGGVFFSRRL
ncbi:MAG: hypothetical protein NC407_11640 [Lachnoclostridium sp.]|nr:hypothetical protein [Lachnoclostridium sp.]